MNRISFRAFDFKRLTALLMLIFVGNILLAQSCPSIKRNNGNNAAHTEYALSVMNTSYTSVPTTSKEGTITVNFGSTFPSASVPVIEGVYVGGTRLNVDFGPPSDPDDDNQHDVEYCFYGTNLAPAHTFTVKFLNPSDGSIWSECTFPSLGGQDATAIDVSSDITNNSVCAGSSITWNVSATKTSNSNSLRYQWYKDGSALSGKTASSLTVSNFSASDAGTYYCQVEEYKSNTTHWSHQTESGTLTLGDCSVLQVTRIQKPDAITTSTTNDLSVVFDVEFNQAIGTPVAADFDAKLDGTYSRTISNIAAFSGSSKRFYVTVNITDNDEGDLALNVASSNSITSTVGSLTLSSTTPTITNDNEFAIGEDGVTSSTESAVAGGDRNGDGVPDRLQKNVSTFPWRTKAKFNQGPDASSGDFVTLSIGDATTGTSKNLDKNLKISTLGVIESSDSYFDGVSFPTSASIGGTTQNVSAIYDPIFFKIEANGNSFAARDLDNSRAGTQIRVYFDMPDGGQNFNSYMKWNGVDGQWYEFVADGNLSTYDDGAEFVDLDGDGDYDRIVLTITEGAKTGGDADGQSNNIIIDPGTIVSTAGLSYTGALSFEVLEGNTPVATLTTSGATTWAITPVTGYDHSLFSIDASTGALSFTSAPDFENPQDVFGTAGDNVHMVRVTISDGSGNSTVIDVEVIVVNKWEKDAEGCPTLSNVSPSTGAGTLFDRYAGDYTQYPSLPGQYTGYVLFTFPLNIAENGLPFIDKIYSDGVELTSDRFDNPRIDDGGNKAYASTGVVQYPYHGNPSQNIFNGSILTVYFSDGSVFSSKDQLCSYVLTSPYNTIVFLDVTDNFTGATSICGGSGSLSVTVNNGITSTTGPNGGTLEYQWQKYISGTWTDISGATTDSYAIANSSQNGDYRCVVKELLSGSVYYDTYNSSTTTVTVVNAPSLSAVSATVCEGSSFPLTATTTNNTGETWTTSDASVATVSSTGSGAATVTGVSTGTATITYADGNGCSTTSAITVSASPSAVLDDNAPSVCGTASTYQLDLSSLIGSPNEFRIDYSSGSLTDVSLTSFTGTTLTLNVPTSTAGSYPATLYLKNTTSNCESSAIPFTLSIDAIPNDGLAVSDATICDGSSASITVSSSEIGYSYQLRNNADDSNEGNAVVGNGGDITFNVTPNSTTSYNVLVTNGTCSVELTDISTIIVDASSVGGTLDDDGSGTGASGATVVAGTNSTTIYLSGQTGSVLRWESSTDNSFSTFTQIANTANTYTATNVNSTTYYRALIQNGSCNPDYSTSFTLSTLSQPTVTFASTTPTACEGDAGTLVINSKSAGADQYRIDWDATAESAGFTDVALTLIPGTNNISLSANNTAATYNATVYVKNSTTGLESAGTAISYTVNATPTITGSASLCMGSSITLNGSGTPAGINPWVSSNTGVATINSSGVVTPVAAGSSIITYTDNNGCSNTATITVNSLPISTISSSDLDNTICDGESITLTSDQSGSGFSYKWFKDASVIPGATGISYSATLSGSYTVEVTNSSTGCLATTTGPDVNTIVVNANPAIALTSSTDVACFGESTGAINISISGGDGNFTVSWSDGGSFSAASEDIGNLFPGTYGVTVTDGNGCSTNASYNITQPASALSASTSSTNVSTAGGSDGSATVTANGGTAGYTYLWSDGQTNATANNLAAGSYSVEIKDANLCSITKNFTITEPSSLSATATVINNVTCNGGTNGSATVSVTGGVGPFTFSWNTTPGQTNATATGLTAGNYVVTVTDANSTVTTANVNITEPTALSVSISASDVACATDLTGGLDATVTGGTPNYTYAWSNGASTDDQLGVGAGTYTLTVTDDNGCIASESATISITDNTPPTVVTQDITVQLDALGSATITAGMINNGSTDDCAIDSYSLDITSFDCDDLGSNTVTLTVTDNNSNSATGTATVTVVDNIDPTITAPAAVTVNVDAGTCATALTNVTLGTPTTGDNCSVASTTNDAPASFPLGNTTVTWTVTDGSGNTATATQVVTVVDNIDPTITAPANVTVNVDAGTCATALANVTLGTPTTGDNCSVASTTNDAPASFPLGNTTVTWTVTDGSGNTATATQVVTVVDNIDPTITAPANVTVNVDAGTCATALTNVTLGTPTTGDNCSVASTTNDAPASFPLGNTTVTWTVTDGSGNTATATQVVTVVDNIDPTITAPANVTVNVDAGTCATALTNVTLGTPTTGDNCSVASTTNDAPASFPLGNTTVTWTVTDGSGNTATATQVVTVVDNIDPTITAPANVTVNVDAGTCATALTNVTLGTPTTGDNCSVASTTNDAPASFPLGNTTVTWTVTDGSGNTATATQVVTVVDNIDPVITCPSDITAYADATTNGTAVTWTAATATDNCSIQSITSDIANGSTFTLGTTTVTYTVIDGSGNSATCTFNVTVLDTVSPVITNCPSDITQNNDAGSCNAVVVWTAPTFFDNSGSYTVVWSHNSGDVFAVGTTTVTATVTDAAGNTTVCSFDVTVVDNEAPVVTAPADVTVNADAGSCNAASSGVVIGTPTVSDNCGIASTTNNVPTAYTLGSNTVTWTVTDIHGNITTVTQTVTVLDAENPTITAPAAVTVNVDAGTCATALTNVTLGTPTTADNCTVASVTNDAPSSFPLGNTTVTWTVTDGSGNTATATQVVTVVDNIDPTITAPANVTVNVDAGTCATALTNVTLGTPTTGDNCSVASTTNDAPASFPLGNTTVTWTVTDGSGNTATATQVVTVVDNIDPVITCPSDITAYADATTNGTAVTWTAATATDNCSIQSITSDIANGSTFTLGTTTVTYTVIDGSGNSATCTFNVTVLDTVSPVITNCPSDITQNNDAGSCNAVVVWTAPTFFDNSGSYTVVWSHNSGDVFAVGTTTVTATVTDAAGNTTVCSFDVTVVDNEAPVVTAPADVTVNADAGSCNAASSGVVIGTPTVSDNCGIASTTNNVPTAYTLGSNTVTWTVTDIHGNITTVTQTVTVLDAEDPVITCPGDFTAYAAADSTLTSVNWSAATATDNCSIDTIYSDVQIGAYLPLGATTVTYVAIDGSGNSDTCSFNITVVDTVSPVITGCPGPITQNNDTDSCGAVVSWTAPVYYDNSDYFTVTASHASGDYFPVGTTTVTITVADSAGNTSVCEFDVTVIDNQVPDVVPFNNVSITLGTDGMYTLTVPEVDSASYDNCGIANRYLSHTFFNCNDVPTASTWLVVEDVHGNKDSSLVTLSVSLPATPVLSITETLGDVLCYGDATGYAQLAVSGGVAPYSYNWSSGSTTFEATGLSLGSYWYEVTDTNGCYSTDTVAIGQPDSLYATTVKSLYTGGYNVSINGASDGSITTTVTGGLTPYTFDWNTGAYSTQNLNGVPAGVYYLTLTDSNGCTFNIIDTLTEPTQLLVTATSLQSVICPDDTAGIAIAVASGAVPPYSYSWDFGATTDYVSGLSYGIYTVTVTDTNGAMASDTVLVDALDYDCDGIFNTDEGGSPNGGGGDGDIDGDGIPNDQDEDSDGDGLPDSEEFDYDNDGVGFDDCDGDGIPNFLDPDLCDLLIPAVFTPNGDGDNDTWEILGIHAFPDNNVQVFNRWGELVYFKEGYDNEFNGRANSRTQMNGGDGLLPTGTYYYIVKVYATGDTYTGYVYITK